ncbi:TPA: T9SS type A sorting domain-containing protein [bacterium]|nr:T9SS type A sorting domain-containing protein [bacterium]
MEIKVEIRWFKDDKHQPSFDNQTKIPANIINKNEKWHFVIRINSSGYVTEWQESEKILIENSMPKAIVSADKIVTNIGIPISFFGSGSNDADNDKLLYKWDFDIEDGLSIDSTEPDPMWKYDKAGEYIVTLIVNDGYAESETAKINIKVEDYLQLVSASYDIPNTSLVFSFNKQIQPLLSKGNMKIVIGESIISLDSNNVMINQIDANRLILNINNQPEIALDIVKLAIVQHQKAKIILDKGLFIDIYGLGNKSISEIDNVELEMTSDGFKIGVIGDVNGNGIINNYDAEFVLQAMAKGLETLPIYEAVKKISRWTARYEYVYDALLDIVDMDKDKQISSYDASLIMRKSSDLTPSIPNFDNYLNKKAIIGIKKQTKKEIETSISLNDNSDVYSADVILNYNPQIFIPKRVSLGSANPNWIMTYVIPEPGKLKVYMAGIIQPQKNGSLLDIAFDAVTDDFIQKPSIYSIQLNAGKINTLAENLPSSSALLQNYPNPCNPETWIPYQLASQSDVLVTIYDINGKVIRKLDIGSKMPGNYIEESKAVYWDGKNDCGEEVISGIYFYSIKCNNFSAIKKMVVKK